MENKKAVFITIVVLLCVFLPLTIIGFIFKDDKNLLDENPGHDTFYKGKIWFYNDEDKYLSSYECQTKICEFAVPTIDDGTYGINYYRDGKLNQVSVVSNKFTFITDGVIIYLYDVVSGNTLGKYKAVKTYNTTTENNTYIVQNSDGVWGAITLGETLGPVLPFEYSFIGLANNLNEDGTLNTDKFIVQKDSKWFIIDTTGAEPNIITGYIDDPIVEYTSEYVFSKGEDKVRIYSYNNSEYLTTYKIKDYVLEDKYIGIVTDNFLLVYDNLNANPIKNITLTNVAGKIDLELSENKLNIKANDEVIESVELS